MKIFIIMLVSLFLSNSLLALTSTNKQIKGLDKLVTVMNYIDKLYVDEKDFDIVVDKFIKAGVASLDPHSMYMDVNQTKSMKVSSSGEFGGVGFVVSRRNNVLTIISPIENTPADKAGIKSGDIIAKINGENSLDMTLEEAVSKMRGKPKTKVSLTIYRKGEKKPLVFNLIRDIITIESVRYKFKDKTLYLKINSFDSHVSSNIKKIITKNKDFDSIILDLRNNPGGLLIEAIKTSDLFLKKESIIVQSKGRDKKENEKWYSKDDDLITERVPMVVLINEGSASASEIVSGALQDNKRAIVIGKTSFGKGSVQQIFDMKNGESLKLTIARYYLPSGRTIQGKGVIPDIIVENVKVPLDNNKTVFKEKDYKNTLIDKFKEIVPIKEKETKKEDDKLIILKKEIDGDLQLKTAIDTLKVLKFNIK